MSKPACLTWTVDGSGLDDWHRDECAMCGGSATIAGRMVMDHDHATGLNYLPCPPAWGRRGRPRQITSPASASAMTR
jgi:hypothetical protein